MKLRYATAASNGKAGGDQSRAPPPFGPFEEKGVEYKTKWFGHDAAVGQRGSCGGSFAVRRVECRGYRCAQLRLTCSKVVGRKWSHGTQVVPELPLVQPGALATKQVAVAIMGEGNPRIYGSTKVTQYNVYSDTAICPESMVLTGIVCSGHYCRYKVLECSWFDDVDCSDTKTKLGSRAHHWHFASAAAAIHEQAQHCIAD